MIIQGKEVIFNEDLHAYTVNGTRAISVTQAVRKYLPDKYIAVGAKTLLEASKRGTRLHNAIEIYEQDGLESEEIQEFRDYRFLKSRYKWEVIESEKMVLYTDKDIVICGRFDQLQRIGDKVILADIKNTSALDKEYLGLQLNLYRMALKQSYGIDADELRGIWLYKGKRKYVSIPINEEIVNEMIKEIYEKN